MSVEAAHPRLPTGTVTFLFTDIEQSTQTIAAIGNERYADMLDQHRRLLRDAFKANHGHEVGTEGDAFFVAFARARDAVAAAIAGQMALRDHPLRVRMGLHTGEALVRDDEYVGHDVHKAKRISDAGHGGQVLLSRTTADLVGTTVDVLDLGPHRLKDLGEPEPLLQVVGHGLAADFPPPRSLEHFSTNLPQLRSSFIGREREIRAVRELLEKNRLVTLTGIGGCGKTRLALQVAAESLDDYPDGAFFVDLSRLTDPESIPATIVEAVGGTGRTLAGASMTAAEPEGRSDDVLLRYLAARKCLLVLDNCEHLVEGSAAIADRIQQRCPAVTILATSREALLVEGEQAWGVPSLQLPSPDSPDCEAVSLFIARAKAARPGFEMTAEYQTLVADICRRLDGIPLAIEFAASRVTHLSPGQIAQKLDDRFRLLTGGRQHVQRQQTLQATLDWSYDLLSDSERVLLRRLAVFPSTFNLSAAEGICSDEALDASGVTDLLGSLVSKSLVEADASEGEARYRLLETVRAYGAERLAHAGEAELLRDRHRDWYQSWIDSFPWDDLLASEIEELPVDTELDNMRAAMIWAESQGRLDMVCRMFTRTYGIGAAHGYLEDRKRWTEVLLPVSKDVGPEEHAICLLAAVGEARYDRRQEAAFELVYRAVDAAWSCHPLILARR